MSVAKACGSIAVPPLRVAVGVATTGRAAVVTELLRLLCAQTRVPDAIVVCAPCTSDLVGATGLDPKVRLILGRPGLSPQRNEILKEMAEFDVVVFFDDDFVPHVQYLELIERAFASYPDIVMTTGRVLADGVRGPGLDVAAAQKVLSGQSMVSGDRLEMRAVYNGYGCNMAIRLAPVLANRVLFDEELPLYAWLEDVDFSRRLARYGRIVEVAAAKGVHLGVKAGRQSGLRLGYSQIANPVYLVRKGTYARRRAIWLMSRNIIANLGRAIRPEPYVDRLGRALGNGRALLDLVRGDLKPSRILSL